MENIASDIDQISHQLCSHLEPSFLLDDFAYWIISCTLCSGHCRAHVVLILAFLQQDVLGHGFRFRRLVLPFSSPHFSVTTYLSTVSKFFSLLLYSPFFSYSFLVSINAVLTPLSPGSSPPFFSPPIFQLPFSPHKVARTPRRLAHDEVTTR